MQANTQLPSRITYHASRTKWLTFSFIPLILLFLTLSALAETDGDSWAFPDRDYRLRLSVEANGITRTNKIAEFDIDFATQLANVGAVGSFDEDSLRVVEVDGNGVALDTAVPFQFDNGTVADTADGTLIFLLNGTTASNTTRTYHVYYDTTGTFSQPAPFTDQVNRQADETYRGQDSFVISTHNSAGITNCTYYYHQYGGGFASILDKDNNDWISYYEEFDGQDEVYSSAGRFRGIPNLGPTFHPGDSGVTSSILEDGPLKLTIHAEFGSGDDLIAAIWDIYPDFARMTLLEFPNNDSYWLLYEGTPGGNLDYEGANKDYLVTSANTQINVDADADNMQLSPEWVYFADGTINRSLYLIHSNDDAHRESYRYQYDYTDIPVGSTDNGAMTVFGFGRHDVDRLMTAQTMQFTIGFAEDRAFNATSGTINDVSQPLLISIVRDSPALVSNTPLQLDEGATAVISNTNLFASDSDSTLITFTVKSLPSYGTLYQNATPLAMDDSFTQDDINAGQISYSHDNSENHSDSFAFTIADETETSEQTTFTITITAVNDPPTGVTDNATAIAGFATIIDLTGNDTDPDDTTLTISNLTQPAHGTVSDNGDGTVTYIADANYSGSDSFTYQAHDGNATSTDTAVTITVTPPNKVYLPMIIK